MTEGYDNVNPFVGDDIKEHDIKFDKLAVAEMVDDKVEPMRTISLGSLTGPFFLLPINPLAADCCREQQYIEMLYIVALSNNI